MADQNIKIGVQIVSNTEEETRKVKGYKAVIEDAKKAAASRSSMGESAAYGQARGSMGATGASARDFANQAQGLGGLVRLYATWAANIFAVSAAFNALSNAANVSNMIEGMNQLGTSSGIALGSMAKRFAEASGGALSLQESIAATTKAVSSGLSQAQFEKLGEVANKASKALGINMSDAVSRLTRGITKLEPELLDELGIFTKVGAASEEYAKRIGKSVLSLTDFEKRQAFANAVLEEGNKKFGEINIKANPYDQLAASLTNLSNNALALVNTALGPLVSALSASPTALTVVVAGLGAMLIKQAIPAIGQYKQALASSAEESEKKWQQKSDAIKKIEKQQFQYLANMSETEAEARLASFEKSEQRLKQSKSKSGIFDERTQAILTRGTFETGDKAYLKSKAAEAEAAGNKQLAAAYTEARVSLQKWILAEKDHEEILKKINAQASTNISLAGKMSAAGYARDELAAAKAAKSRSLLISEASEAASTGTMSGAWAKLKAGIKEEGLTGASAGLTKLGGAAAIATTVFSRGISVISGFFGQIGIAISILSALYSLVSSNSKATEELNAALDQSSESAKTATSTFQKYANVLSAESISAKANATVGLVDANEKLIQKYQEFSTVSNSIDRAWESLKSLFNLSKQDTLAENLSGNIMSALNNLDDPALKSSVEFKLKNLFDLKYLNFEDIEKGIKKLKPDQLNDLNKATEELKVKNQAAALSVASLIDGYKAVASAYTTLENTLKPSDPISSFASSLAKQSVVMTEAFKDPKLAAIAFQEVLKNSSYLNAFPPEAAAQILAASNDYKDLSESIKDSQEKISSLNKELAKGAGIYTGLFTGQKAELELKIKADQASLLKLGSVMQKVAADSLEYAFKISLEKMQSASALARVDQQKTLLGILPKSENTIKAQMSLENQSIDIRKQEIKAVYALVQEMKITRASSSVDQITKKLEELPASKESQRPELNTQLSTAKAELAIYQGKISEKDVPKELRGTYFEQMQISKGVQSQLNVLDINKLTNIQKSAVETKLAQLEESNKNDARFIKTQEEQRNSDLANTKLTLEERAKIEADYLDTTKEQRLRQATLTERQAVIAAETTIGVLTKPSEYGIKGVKPDTTSETFRAATKDLPGYKEVLKTAEDNFKVQQATTKTLSESALQVATTNRDYDRQAVLVEQSLASATLKYDTEKQSLSTAQETINRQVESGALNKQEYDIQTRLNKLKEIDLDTTQQILLAQSEYNKKLLAADKELAAGAVTPARSAEIAEDRKTALQFYTDSKSKIYDLAEAQKGQAQATFDSQQRQQAYADIFKNSFNSMADAIVNWAETGKLQGKELFKSLLADLLRYEMRLQAMSMYETFRPGLMNFVGNLLGPAAPLGPASGATMDVYAQQYGAAKGRAYDTYGVEAFAQGGAFTNSIVNSPTMFKFARGTGLMGEAGPEAIMPLKRDSNGNLGVRAGGSGGETTVVVNNYTTEKAETRETTDSRGNRKIEVIVGDMTAGELSRSGSASQKAVGSTFGLRPQLIRR